jgi:hypothetical protein
VLGELVGLGLEKLGIPLYKHRINLNKHCFLLFDLSQKNYEIFTKRKKIDEKEGTIQ